MTKRSIALGASVLALALAGPAQANPGALGEVAPKLPETDVAAKVQANIDVNAKANVPLTLPVKGKHGTVRPAGKVDTSVKGKGSAGTSGVDARFARNGSANAGTGGLGTRVGLEQDGRVEAGARHHGLSGKATARVRGNARGDARIRHGRVSGKARGHLKQSAKARSHGLAKPRFDVPSERHSKGGLPLRGVGREVGNAVQLSLAGWLIALTAGACFGASRFVRRLQRLGS